MGPEQSPTLHTDVDRIPRNAVTPLQYRRAVRALLGMPEAEEENLTFARTVPPVGFQYHPHSPAGETWRIPQPPDDTVPLAVDAAQTTEPHSPEGIPGEAASAHRPVHVLRKWLVDTPAPLSPTTVAPSPSTLEQPPGVQPDAATRYPSPAVDTRTNDQRGFAPRSVQHQAAGAPPAPGRTSAAAAAPDRQAADVLKPTTIAVPGLSERSQYYSPIAPETPEDKPASTVTAPSPQRVEPADSPQQRAASIAYADEAQASLTEVTRKVQAGANQNEATLPPDLHPRRIPSSVRKEGEAGSIEQLHRMVRALAAQVASWQTRTPHASQRQQAEQKLPRRVERVVIVKQAAQHSGPPRAFWERSYLRHWWWRTMR